MPFTVWTRLPNKLTELKQLLTDHTGNKKTYSQDESGNYRKTIWHLEIVAIDSLACLQGEKLFVKSRAKFF